MNRRTFLRQSGFLAALSPLAWTGLASEAQATAHPAPAPVLVPPQPPLDHKGSMDIRVCIRSAMTGGRYSAVECAVAPKTMGPSPHAHQELDELMFVRAGTAHVLMGEEVVTVSAGGWHLRPRQIKHTFWNAGDDPLNFIDMYFDQPFEEYLEEIFHRLTPENGYISGSEKKRVAVHALTERFGLIRFPEAAKERAALIKRFALKGD